MSKRTRETGGHESSPSRSLVLFLCTGNSCRSQMAEGWARELLGDRVEPFSAGVEPSRLDPRAVAVMAEAGVDISTHRSKSLSEVLANRFELVVTVCSDAQRDCPVFPGRVKVVHRSFDDPPRAVDAEMSEAEALPLYRRVRDEIRAFVVELPDLLPLATNSGERLRLKEFD